MLTKAREDQWRKLDELTNIHTLEVTEFNQQILNLKKFENINTDLEKTIQELHTQIKTVNEKLITATYASDNKLVTITQLDNQLLDTTQKLNEMHDKNNMLKLEND